MEFNVMDWGIVVILTLSLMIGLIRGFVRELLSLIVCLAAVFLSLKFAPNFAHSLPESITNSAVRYGIAFAGIGVVVMIVGGLIKFVLSRFILTTVSKTGLNLTDRILGLFFGLARGLVIIAFILLLVRVTPLTQHALWKQSALRPYVSWVVEILEETLPSALTHDIQSSLQKLQADNANKPLQQDVHGRQKQS